MKRKFFVTFGLVGLFVLAGLFFTGQSKAAAASWCGVLAPAVNPPPPNSNCLSGQNYNALENLKGLSGDSLKSAFISDMHNFEKGQEPQQVGAKWTEQHLYTKSDMSWEARVQESDVVAKIVSNYGFSLNTAYVPSSNSITQYSESSNADSLVFYVGSTPYFAIKLDCGNPVNGLPGLPSAPPLLQGFKVNTAGSTSGAYSDDRVAAYKNGGYVRGTTDQPYYFRDNIQLPAGTYTIKATDAGTNDGAWQFVGYTFCDAANKSCSLTPANYTAAGSGGFSVTLQNGHTYNMRIVYAQTNAPSGSITAQCTSPTQGTVTASFRDSDTSSTYKMTAQLMVGGTPYTKTVSSSPGSMGPYSFTIPNTGSITIKLTVNDVGPAANSANNFSVSKTVTGSGCASATGGTTCPTFTTNPQTVNLSANPSTAPTSADVSGYSDSSPNTAYTYQASGHYKITDVTDGYQSATKSDGSTGWSPTADKSPNPFYIYYDRWIDDYPYDTHKITIKYQTYYDRTTYTASTTKTYYCKQPGYSYYSSDTTCRYYYPVGSYYTCGSGEYVSGSSCYNSSDNSYAGGATINYDCPSGGSWNGTDCGYASYSADYHYAWVKGTTASDYTSVADSQAAPTLPECYNRNFDVLDSETMVNNITFDNQEDPNSVTISWQTQVEFTLQHGGLGVHNAALVKNLQYAGTYTIKHADGTETPFTPSGESFFFTDQSGSPTPTAPAYVDHTGTQGPFTATVPPLQVGDEICATFTVTPEGSEVNEQGIIQTNNGQPVTASEQCSQPIVNEPYVQFFGGDVSAGGGFGNISCGTQGDIKTNWYTGGPPSRGSAVQFGALAFGSPTPGTIRQLASASQRTNAPRAPYGLDFANTSINAAAGTSAGIGGEHCVPDYYLDKPDSAVTSGPIDPTTSKAYNLTGSQTIGALSISNGANVTVFVKGDVDITGNITYANTSWPTLKDVPSFFLIVEGNIYIDPAVTHLEGVYIAQDGLIDTCANGFGVYAPSDIYQHCGPWSGNGYQNTQLTVNGAFIANTVNLHRAFSSLRHAKAPAPAPEWPGAASHPCDVENGANTASEPDCAAEIFNFSPETYLANPIMNVTAGPTKDKYDYLTSLSPVL